MKRSTGWLFIGIILLLLIAQVFALLAMEKITNGRVKSIQQNVVTIVHKSQDGMNVQAKDFEVNEQTRFEEKILSFDQLKAGDQIIIKYKEADNKRIAKEISRVKDVNEEKG